MSNTFHVSLDVPDLERAVAFYGDLFGQQPAKRKPGYAKFELTDPPVALALQQAERPALSPFLCRSARRSRAAPWPVRSGPGSPPSSRCVAM